MKLLWSVIQSIVNIKNTSSTVISKLKYKNGNLTTDPLVIAETFDEFFANVTNSVTEKIPRAMKFPFNFLKNRMNIPFFISPSVPMEVSDAIYLLKTGKSVGPNSIHIKLLKTLSIYVYFPFPCMF